MEIKTTRTEKALSLHQVAAEATVRSYMLFTGAAGIIPVPIVDTAAIAALQFSMLSKVGDIYGHKLSSHWGKSLISSLIGGYTATMLGTGIGFRLVRSIPIIGGLASLVVMPGFAAASTWALGQIFILHFESGGNFLDFDPAAVKETYSDFVKKGEKVIDDLKSDKKTAAPHKEATEHHEVTETTTQHKTTK